MSCCSAYIRSSLRKDSGTRAFNATRRSIWAGFDMLYSTTSDQILLASKLAFMAYLHHDNKGLSKGEIKCFETWCR
jgi:hypothetical protein